MRGESWKELRTLYGNKQVSLQPLWIEFFYLFFVSLSLMLMDSGNSSHSLKIKTQPHCSWFPWKKGKVHVYTNFEFLYVCGVSDGGNKVQSLTESEVQRRCLSAGWEQTVTILGKKTKKTITAEKCIMESYSTKGIEAIATITIKITPAPPRHTTPQFTAGWI